MSKLNWSLFDIRQQTLNKRGSPKVTSTENLVLKLIYKKRRSRFFVIGEKQILIEQPSFEVSFKNYQKVYCIWLKVC